MHRDESEDLSVDDTGEAGSFREDGKGVFGAGGDAGAVVRPNAQIESGLVKCAEVVGVLKQSAKGARYNPKAPVVWRLERAETEGL